MIEGIFCSFFVLFAVYLINPELANQITKIFTKILKVDYEKKRKVSRQCKTEHPEHADTEDLVETDDASVISSNNAASVEESDSETSPSRSKLKGLKYSLFSFDHKSIEWRTYFDGPRFRESKHGGRRHRKN